MDLQGGDGDTPFWMQDKWKDLVSSVRKTSTQNAVGQHTLNVQTLIISVIVLDKKILSCEVC